MHISHLPPELHAHIVAFACAEMASLSESSTAHAISRVSSYWYDIAGAFKYHSLRIAGSRSIAKQLERLEQLPERERRVRYLALSDTPSNEAMDGETFQRRTNIARLLALVMPSLYMLELHLSNTVSATSLFALLWELPAPCLLSLSIKGYYPFPTAPLNSSTQNATSNFPRLEHLSLDGVANPSGLFSFNSLERAFPRLQTLEVHGLRGALAFAHEVAEAVSQRDQKLKGRLSSEKMTYCARLPRTLRSLSLFPLPATVCKYSKRGHALHTEMLEVLVPLTMRDMAATEPRLQVVVVESSTCGGAGV